MDEHPTTKLAREYADCGEIGSLGPMRTLAEFARRLLALEAVVDAAEQYRAAEQDETPRLWKGKRLCDLAEALDSALDKLKEGR